MLFLVFLVGVCSAQYPASQYGVPPQFSALAAPAPRPEVGFAQGAAPQEQFPSAPQEQFPAPPAQQTFPAAPAQQFPSTPQEQLPEAPQQPFLAPPTQESFPAAPAQQIPAVPQEQFPAPPTQQTFPAAPQEQLPVAPANNFNSLQSSDFPQYSQTSQSYQTPFPSSQGSKLLDTSVEAPESPVTVPQNSRVNIQDSRLQYTHGFSDDKSGTQVAEQGSLLSTNEGWEYVIVKKGSYSYISPEGVPVKVNYIADHNGFRIV